jgi:hypothetical protein
MDRSTYLAGVAELYAAEILGEALATRWLDLASDPDEKYKLSLFLQLESEAKVRLRPLLARHGIPLVEDEALRSDGAAAAAEFASRPWPEAMATLAELALPYAQRFQALVDVAPPEDVPLVMFMVDHEQSVMRMAEREAAGESVMDRELLVMLSYPIPRAAQPQQST